MPLPQRAIEELKAIHRQHAGEGLTAAEAHAMGNRLLRVFAVLLQVRAPFERDDEVRPQFRRGS